MAGETKAQQHNTTMETQYLVLTSSKPGGGGEGSDFHVFNLAPHHYHRAGGLPRTGAINVTCNIERRLHGVMSADSDYYATLIAGGGSIEAEKISYPSTYSLMPTTQEEITTKGGETTVGIEQIGSRFRPPYRIATWTLSENESQRSGLPASLKVAVLVSREDRKKFFFVSSRTPCRNQSTSISQRRALSITQVTRPP
ncbi:hypothetical protein CHGG_00008 [Chaetomium globosum CBS 148.51]|uniref:Uncharacterized protein n=1 Tax=Chaetomium globosum (strain ATCC 6205 / CBS 148.51 / DSM 1962 / NBRC 6347 / NRRL 1970) TaxID=306901 RepID=Q2HIE6_CHAGB|nr:uncharacterized protein CHGG_00008 [Chaetomium globosum CBS 148.51]EAQ91773.1 hypothetical protein CHGG_00008 [Chaetomium globosum CBS 148.51]